MIGKSIEKRKARLPVRLIMYIMSTHVPGTIAPYNAAGARWLTVAPLAVSSRDLDRPFPVANPANRAYIRYIQLVPIQVVRIQAADEGCIWDEHRWLHGICQKH
jgi:hypothetical protein